MSYSLFHNCIRCTYITGSNPEPSSPQPSLYTDYATRTFTYVVVVVVVGGGGDGGGGGEMKGDGVVSSRMGELKLACIFFCQENRMAGTIWITQAQEG